jgi:hypothetical protein
MTIALAAFWLAAAAADAVAPNPVADDVQRCRGVTLDADRLACYDRTIAVFAAAREKRELVVVDRTEVRKARRSLFGFTLPSFRIFGGGNDDEREQIKQVDSTVTSASPAGYNQFALVLADGSVWQTTEASSSFRPRAGDKITVRRTAFGYSAKSGYGVASVRRTR